MSYQSNLGRHINKVRGKVVGETHKVAAQISCQHQGLPYHLQLKKIIQNCCFTFHFPKTKVSRDHLKMVSVPVKCLFHSLESTETQSRVGGIKKRFRKFVGRLQWYIREMEKIKMKKGQLYQIASQLHGINLEVNWNDQFSLPGEKEDNKKKSTKTRIKRSQKQFLQVKFL